MIFIPNPCKNLLRSHKNCFRDHVGSQLILSIMIIQDPTIIFVPNTKKILQKNLRFMHDLEEKSCKNLLGIFTRECFRSRSWPKSNTMLLLTAAWCFLIDNIFSCNFSSNVIPSKNRWSAPFLAR